MEFVNGGICAPIGFLANGIHCGIRKNKSKKDLALITSDVDAVACCVYTTNLVKGAPIYVTQKNIEGSGIARAVIVNSGNANTCNSNGIEIAQKMCELVQRYTGIASEKVIVASTGVIGQPLSIDPIANGMKELVLGLGKKSLEANEAIMTTDTIHKEVAVKFELSGKECHIGGIAKGSGMIHPNMATMLAFLTSDVNISPVMLKKALKNDVESSFNMLSVDGDTSTNDMLSIMANGLSGNELIDCENKEYKIFCEALNKVSTKLTKLMASDGEGATKMLECYAYNADSTGTARKVAKSVICSSLLKAAMFGADANWGRVLCAIGYSKADVDVSKIDVDFCSEVGKISVCKNGSGIAFCEEDAKKILLQKEIQIAVNLNCGNFSAKSWGCDLTYDYVKINGDYRT